MKTGFTLIEIMIVVVIIGLLATVGVPKLIDVRNQGIVDDVYSKIVLLNSATDTWRSTYPGTSYNELKFEDLAPFLPKQVNSLDKFFEDGADYYNLPEFNSGIWTANPKNTNGKWPPIDGSSKKAAKYPKTS